MDTLTFIGTATCLLTIDGVRILTDPALYHGGELIHLGWGLFSRRKIPPATDAIGDVDAVLLTHTHLDHFDQAAVEFLGKKVPVFTNVKDASKLRKQGFTNVTGLELDEEIEFRGVRIRALPARHGPLIMRPFTGAVIGFGIESSQGKLWVSGDTVGTGALKSALESFDPKVGIVYFGGVRYIFRLTFSGADALRTLRHARSLKLVHAVHVDDWTHFRTRKEGISEVFASSEVQLIFPPRGEAIALWLTGEQI